jgi:hypothetical protein
MGETGFDAENCKAIIGAGSVSRDFVLAGRNGRFVLFVLPVQRIQTRALARVFH